MKILICYKNRKELIAKLVREIKFIKLIKKYKINH